MHETKLFVLVFYMDCSSTNITEILKACTSVFECFMESFIAIPHSCRELYSTLLLIKKNLGLLQLNQFRIINCSYLFCMASMFSDVE